MSLSRKPKDIQKTVKILTEPEPSFVSLVEHGANQTPFKVVKSLQYKINEKDMEMPKTARQVAKAAENTLKSADDKAIVGIRFAKENFADEAAVTKWLEEGGYEDFTVKAVEAGFEVSSKSEGDDYAGETTELDTGIGVTFKIAQLSTTTKTADEETAAEAVAEGEGEVEGSEKQGKCKPKKSDNEPDADADGNGNKRKKSAEGDEEEAPAAPAEEDAEKSATQKSYEALSTEATQKFDMFGAWFSDKADLSGVLGDANDGIPMGYGELMFAFETALMNASRANDEAAVKQCFKDVSKVFLGLWKVAEKIGAPDTTQGDMAAKAAESTAEATAEATPEAAPAVDVAKAVEEAVAKAMSGVASLIDTKLNETVATLSSKADEVAGVAKEAKDIAEKANTKASQLESVTQTRKSADIGDIAGSTQTQGEEVIAKKEAAFTEKMLKNTLGF